MLALSAGVFQGKSSLCGREKFFTWIPSQANSISWLGFKVIVESQKGDVKEGYFSIGECGSNGERQVLQTQELG